MRSTSWNFSCYPYLKSSRPGDVAPSEYPHCKIEAALRHGLVPCASRILTSAVHPCVICCYCTGLLWYTSMKLQKTVGIWKKNCIESRENKAAGWMVQLFLALLFSKLVFSCFIFSLIVDKSIVVLSFLCYMQVQCLEDRTKFLQDWAKQSWKQANTSLKLSQYRYW